MAARKFRTASATDNAQEIDEAATREWVPGSGIRVATREVTRRVHTFTLPGQPARPVTGPIPEGATTDVHDVTEAVPTAFVVETTQPFGASPMQSVFARIRAALTRPRA